MPSIKNVPGKEFYTDNGSRFCGGWTNGLPRNDFYYISEELFQKKTGEFYLRGEGGAASKYAKRCGYRETCFGKRYTSLSYEEARSWAETHIDKADYIKTFGTPNEED